MAITFVMGPATAGKSTYIKQNFKDCKIIDLWDIQKDMVMSATSLSDNILTSYEICKQNLIEAVKNNEDVVLEHTLLRAIRRKIYIDAIKELGDYEINCIVIKPDKKVLLERRKKRGLICNEKQIEEELNVLEIPTKEEGFSNIKIIEE